MSDPTDVAERAEVAAAHAATRAGIRIVEPDDPGMLDAVSQLLDTVWGRGGARGTILAREALVAIAHAGGQVSAALADDALIGATVAFLGRQHDSGEVFLHSHVTGVRREAERGGVGRALKWHQRAWALRHGLHRVRWTFDPLVRRNAVLNLRVLGARAAAYERDVYGRMDDERNAGAPTDRLVVDWELTAARVEVAASGRTPEPDLAALRRAGAEVILEVADDGAPHLTPRDADRRLIQAPADIESLRRDDPAVAAAWGAAIREALGGSLDAGFRITGITREGWYVLGLDPGLQELTARQGDP